jgi:TetR/AcrR family transcriptional regulator
MSTSKRADRLPANERRAVTVQAVIKLAAEQNPSEITTTAIAQCMRMTQGALFRHFQTKDAIWQAVMEWVAERILASVGVAAQPAASPLAALEAVFLAHIDFVVRHTGVPRIVFGELQRSGNTPAKRLVRTFLGQYVERLQTLIEQGKVRGEIASVVDTKAAATLFVGMVQGLVVQSLVSGEVGSMRAKAPGSFAIYLRGIRKTT